MNYITPMADCQKLHPSVVDRYFIKKYKTDVRKKRGEDQCVLLHSNRICISTIAPSHPIIEQKKKVKSIDFQIDKDINRSQNKVTGKSKKGAQWLTELAPLCHVTCEDGSAYTLCSCVKGSLVEINENLITNPQLLVEKPDSDGYIGIILTKLQDYEKEKEKLLSQEAYDVKLEKRKLQTLSSLAGKVNPTNDTSESKPGEDEDTASPRSVSIGRGMETKEAFAAPDSNSGAG